MRKKATTLADIKQYTIWNSRASLDYCAHELERMFPDVEVVYLDSEKKALLLCDECYVELKWMNRAHSGIIATEADYMDWEPIILGASMRNASMKNRVYASTRKADIRDIGDWDELHDGGWIYEGYDFNAYIKPKENNRSGYDVDVYYWDFTPAWSGDFDSVMHQGAPDIDSAFDIAEDIVDDLFGKGIIKGGSIRKKAKSRKKSASVIKIREFIKMDIDIDVVDDYCEELYIAFCGPLGLTAAGETAWADVLDMDIDITHIGGYNPIAVVLVEDSEQKMQRAKDFFESVAGFCPASDWDKWFVFE